MPYRPADPALQAEYERLTAELPGDTSPDRRRAASDMALRLRSRMIDLATWQADSGPEYRTLQEQCRRLTAIAAADADPALVREFGS